MTLLNIAHQLPLPRFISRDEFVRLLSTTHLYGWYWRVSPAFHRKRRYLSPEHVDPPIEPFSLHLVDPDRITRFTGREYPVWTTRWEDIGRVVDGDWDQRESPPIRPRYSGPDHAFYLAERFTETPLYQGLAEHFVDGVPWEDLPFVNDLMDRVEQSDSSVWQNCTSAEEIRQYCRELDRLYRSMRDRGCLSVRELMTLEDRKMTVREVMENEILVDVSRTGEPLFVTGRHRLSLAKILGLERVPVCIVVRHPEWIARTCGRRDTDAGLETESKTCPEPGVGEPYDVSW